MHLCWSMWKSCLVLRHLGWMFCSKSVEKLNCRWSDDCFAPQHHPQMKTKNMSKENRPSWVVQWELTSWLTGRWHFCHCCAFFAIWSGPRPFCNCIWYMRFVTLIATVFCKVLFAIYSFPTLIANGPFPQLSLQTIVWLNTNGAVFQICWVFNLFLANNQLRSLEIVNIIMFYVLLCGNHLQTMVALGLKAKTGFTARTKSNSLPWIIVVHSSKPPPDQPKEDKDKDKYKTGTNIWHRQRQRKWQR